MRFILQFDMDNAAFGDSKNDVREEAARVLASVQERFADSGFAIDAEIPVRDTNGNKIGYWVVERRYQR
jgi:hypothetical protein